MKNKLLTTVQRKALVEMLEQHAKKQYWKCRKHIENRIEPQHLRRARAIMDKHEEDQQNEMDAIRDLIEEEKEMLKRTLLFADVDSCLSQVNEYTDKNWLPEL